MVRNRMIQPEFWSNESISRLSLESNLFLISIWNFADDYGMILNNNRQLLGNCFPLRNDVDEKKIEKWKNELIESGLLICFEHEGKKIIYIRDWEDQQTIPNRSKRNLLGYHESNQDVKDIIKSLISVSLESNESLISVSLESNSLTDKCKLITDNSITDKKKGRSKDEDKKPYGEFNNVKLTDEELHKLLDRIGDTACYALIERMSRYIEKHGKKYKSHYAALLDWKESDANKDIFLNATKDKETDPSKMSPDEQAEYYAEKRRLMKERIEQKEKEEEQKRMQEE